jgi:hypothetical protein
MWPSYLRRICSMRSGCLSTLAGSSFLIAGY